jgi:hypothetical protein
MLYLGVWMYRYCCLRLQSFRKAFVVRNKIISGFVESSFVRGEGSGEGECDLK